MHLINTEKFTAEVSVYGENLICIDIADGKSHVESGAILPLKEIGSRLTENSESFCVSTGTLTAEISKSDGTIRFLDKNGNLISCTYPENNYITKENAGFELNFRMTDSEHIYGLGEDNDIAFGRLDRRGTVRDMLTGQRINQNHVTADFPIPFIISAGGNAPYGIYLDNTSNLTVDIGKTVSDKLNISAPDGACRIYFIAGENIPEIVCGFSEITGRAKLPPMWVLGYMQSRCSFWNWEEIDDAILTFAEKNIPLDSIVFDFDWAQYFNNYKWADRWEGKSSQKIKEYREKYGIHFMASNSGPMLKKDSDTFDSAVEAGVLAHDTDGNTVTCGHYSGELIDFTNPDTEKWIAPQLEKIMDDGVEAWWLDLTEPEGDAENTVYHAGSRAEVHNIFSNATSETYHNIMKRHNPEKRSFILTRTGTAGIQRNPTALWTGDVYSEYGTLQAHVPEALNTQLCGIPMWTCDTGGFLSPTNNEDCPHNLYHNDRTEHSELYERWMQFSCFTPVFRSHHAGEAVPFRFNDITVDGMAHYIKLRYKLIPYVYSLYYENFLNGTPIMRPLFWHYPDDKRAYNVVDEYLFGENMLVAPVLEAQQNYRKVYFPKGKWYDFDYDYVYEGGKEYEVYAPQNRIPVFVKAGGIIPMSRDICNTRELDLSRLEAIIYPNSKSTCKIYADDGVTDGYLDGEYTATEISCEETENMLKIALSASNEKFSLKEFTAHIHMTKAPKKITMNGKEFYNVNRVTTVKRSDKNVFCFDEFKRMLHIKVFLESGENFLEISLKSNSHYRECEPFSEEKLAGQLPYIYPPAAVPCMIQAIHYDRGGEGEAFHKNVPDTKGVYRDDNAGIADDGAGCYIKALEKGEWLEYTISSAKEGNYEVILEGSLNGAEIVVTIENSSAKLDGGKAVLNLGTGQKILRVEVTDGCADIGIVRIERKA